MADRIEEYNIEVKLALGDPSGAPAFLSNAEAIGTNGGMAVLYFYEATIGPSLDPDSIKELALKGPVPTRCVAKVVMPHQRISALAQLLNKHLARVEHDKPPSEPQS